MTAALRITSGPIMLRPPAPDDAPQVFELAREPEVSRYLQWQPHRTIADSNAYIADSTALWLRRVAFLLGIFESGGERRFIGGTGLSNLVRHDFRAEVGTWLGAPYQGKGYNLHVKAAVFAMGFQRLGLRRLELLARVDNERSRAALQRLPGVVEEGVQHCRIFQGGVGHDAHMFAITEQTYDPAAYPDVTIEGALV